MTHQVSGEHRVKGGAALDHLFDFHFRPWYASVVVVVVLGALCGRAVREFLWEGNAFCHELSYADESLDESTEVLFVGSSHVFQGIDPRLITLKSGNLGYGSANLSVSKMLIEQHLPRLSGVRMVVLQCEGWSFRTDSLYAQQYNYRTLLDERVPLSRIRLPSGLTLQAWANTILGLDFPSATLGNVWARRLVRQQWRGVEGFKPPWTGERAETKEESASEASTPTASVADEVEALDQIIAYCEDRGVRLILVRLPHTPGYEEQSSTKLWQEQVDRLIKRGRIQPEQVWDFYAGNICEFDERDFVDSNHLHPNAIPKLCDALNQLIDAEIVELDDELTTLGVGHQ